MSDDNTTFETGVPAPEYTPMPDAYAAPAEKPREYSADPEGITEAGSDVAEQRAKELPIIPREYVTIDPNSPEHGQPRPANETVSIERAADDLTRQRGFEAAELEQNANLVTAIETDALRAEHQPQPQPEPIAPQPEAPLPEGVDPEIADALQKSPKLRQALEQEAQRIQQVQQEVANAQQAYSKATQDAYAFAIQSMIASVPELQGVSVQEMPIALLLLAQQNPQRHAEAVQHLARIEQLGKAHQEAQQQQAQQVQAHVAQWAKIQDSETDSWLAKTEHPETVKSVKEALPRVLESFGVSVDEFARAVQQTPVLRSAPMQKMLYTLAKTHMLRDQASEKIAKPVPPVQRPGVAQPPGSRDHAGVAEAKARFLANPNDPKLAAAFIHAKRNASR